MKPAAVVCFGTLLVFVLVLGLSDWRQTQRAAAPLLPVTFAHGHHGTVNCLVCHHNFADKTGSGLCLECHRDHKDVSALREEHFHGLCRDCHRRQQSEGEKHGPVRECSGCHVADTDP